jgi:hypothetical protein
MLRTIADFTTDAVRGPSTTLPLGGLSSISQKMIFGVATLFRIVTTQLAG